MKKNDNLPHLLLAIDPGASSIKVVCSLVGDDKCYPFMIAPDCLDLDLVHESDRIPEPNPDFDHRSVWVRIGTKHYAVGNLVKTKYCSYTSIKPLKNDSIVPKIVAAIASAHRHFQLPKKFKVSIASVLPPGEFIYSQKVSQELLSALRSCETPAGKIVPILAGIDIKPEGYGILNWHKTRGIAEDKDIGVIMFGFRNTSVLFSVEGELTGLKSSEHGFYQVLEQISSLSGGGYNERELVVPVWNYLINKNELGFKKISRSANFDLELSMIKSAVEKSMTTYMRNLQSWLLSAMQKTDMIVLCGGNAEYIDDNLDKFLEDYTTYYSGRGHLIGKHILYSSIPPEITETGIAVRYLDIYCLWLELSCKNQNELVVG